MNTAHTLVTVAALFLCSSTLLAEDSFRPLDTRTRCIVLFRECLVLINKKDVNGIFKIVADGKATNFKLTPDPDSFSPKLKEELQDVNRFFNRNFRSASLLERNFNKIHFSELVTAKKSVSVTNTATDKEDEAILHSIKIKITIPDTDRDEIVELRFVQIADEIYWVPIGW